MNPAELSSLLTETTASITEILVEAEHHFSENPDDFVAKDYGVLWRVTNCYSLLFKNSGCEKRDDLEKLWASYFSESSIRDAVEELLLVEGKWDEFLLTVDEFMEKKMCSENEHTVNEKQIASLSLTRIDDNTMSTVKQITNNNKYSLFVFLRHFA
ncbi:hypothetical protein GHT06_013745 [Daphnia sinensis]|uniref:Uncharacterized protein n=1 Tax=Daphnia sinensis TaxID=1820382 RepID=A0AAD5PY81_9CRUS|nr:hypothetical protein GHT06_013745 [Daphnia sinensis]